MKNLGVILAVGITAVLVITIGIFNFLLISEAEPLSDLEDMQAPLQETTVVPDVTAIQAAYDARELLLQAQIAELDTEIADRQATYDLQVEDLGGLIMASEEQLTQSQDQEIVIQEQIDHLLFAQTERTTNYESQRQQAYYQYQVNIQQLQTQLDEANGKLYEALARLGQ